MKKYNIVIRSLFIVAFFACFTQSYAQNKGMANMSSNTDSAAILQAKQLKQADQNVSDNRKSHAQWFPKAGLGLFIHWGMSAVTATGDLSWNMIANKPWKDATMTPNQYYAQAKRWNPDKMDFDKILKAAKATGITYAVFVTRHHDGFAFWPSQYSEIGTKELFNGRDFVKEFVHACRKYKIRVGLYYSPPDWYYERKYKNFSWGKNVFDMDHKPTVLPQKPDDFEQKRCLHIQNQVTELLTNYGKIDMIWFDGGHGEISNARVRELQPGIVINRRNGKGGDYGDSEGALPQKRFSGWFETCETCWPSHKWSFSENAGWDTAADVITELVKLRAWGGNLLANVGPKASGEIPQQALNAWEGMAKWMKYGRESVIGADAGPWPTDVNTPVTTRKGVAYIHLLPGENETVVWKNAPKPKKMFLMKTKTPVEYTYRDNTLTVNVPLTERTDNVDVIKVVL